MSGMMDGFPPPQDSQVTLANWRTSPFNRWGFQHVREIVPSADIAYVSDDLWRLQQPVDANLTGLMLDDGQGGDKSPRRLPTPGALAAL